MLVALVRCNTICIAPPIEQSQQIGGDEKKIAFYNDAYERSTDHRLWCETKSIGDGNGTHSIKSRFNWFMLMK